MPPPRPPTLPRTPWRKARSDVAGTVNQGLAAAPKRRSRLSPRAASCVVLAAGTLILYTAAACQQPRSPRAPRAPKEHKMEETFVRLWEPDNVPLAAPSQPIRPAAKAAEPARAAAGADRSTRRKFVNDELNSRSALAVGANAKFQLRWSWPISPLVGSGDLVAAGDRLVLCGSLSWQLLDRAGQEIARQPIGHSGVTIDPGLKLFYVAKPSGALAGYRLDTGALHHSILLGGGDNFDRQYLARRDNALLVVSVEREVDVHAPLPENMMIERVDLKDPSIPAEPGKPRAPSVVDDLRRKTRVVQPVMYGGTLAMATRDRVFFIDETLRRIRAVTGEFLPVAMSADETGRLYMVVLVHQRPALWVVNESGERAWEFPLPADWTTVTWLPIVGYDHTVFLVSGSQILALTPAGKVKWRKTAAGPVAGAIVTPDGFLLTSEGTQLAIWDGEGERRTLFDAKQPLVSAPVLTEYGDLVVAAAGAVLDLAPAN